MTGVDVHVVRLEIRVHPGQLSPDDRRHLGLQVLNAVHTRLNRKPWFVDAALAHEDQDGAGAPGEPR